MSVVRVRLASTPEFCIVLSDGAWRQNKSVVASVVVGHEVP
jgi:hypothetical protein